MAMPSVEATSGNDERLEQDHPANLLAGGTDGPQQAKLPSALRDDDAERVHDDVRANEERDQRESDREDVDVVQDRVKRVRLLLRLLLSCDGPRAVGMTLEMGSIRLSGLTPSSAITEID